MRKARGSSKAIHVLAALFVLVLLAGSLGARLLADAGSAPAEPIEPVAPLAPAATLPPAAPA